MTTIYLIRHAEAEGTSIAASHGWYDSLITKNGERQIQALQQRFDSVPLTRSTPATSSGTQLTAGAVYLPKGLPLHLHPGLREIHMGDWEDRHLG